jgi:hypothetical protein
LWQKYWFLGAIAYPTAGGYLVFKGTIGKKDFPSHF